MAVVLTHDEVWPSLTRYWHSRKVFRNVCSWRKSRAEMLGKQNYLPGPNVLTICCIVLEALPLGRNRCWR